MRIIRNKEPRRSDGERGRGDRRRGATAPDLLRGQGLRDTRARRIILESVRATGEHPTAERVFRRVRRRLPRVSLATVYRNLRQLVHAGLLVERADAGGSRFDGNLADHHHFTCLACGRVFDVAEAEGHARAVRAVAESGFEVLHHRVEFYGRCAACMSSHKGRKTGWQPRV